ncbi:MAG: hypothetical protein MZV63_03730 [Marinilabiliales bacterium]|nr:hypothetical protein [Marinilabiliales bacterium]
MNKGYIDVSGVLVKDSSYILHSAIDRALFRYEFRKIPDQAVRTKNKPEPESCKGILMMFSMHIHSFDFDYEERPGVDAYQGSTLSGK